MSTLPSCGQDANVNEGWKTGMDSLNTDGQAISSFAIFDLMLLQVSLERGRFLTAYIT